jgi:nitroreductase
VAKKRFDYRDSHNKHAIHDLGAANVLLGLQATEMGMQVHQMGGFDMDITLEHFELDITRFEPVSFIAVGYPGDPDILPPDLRERELAPRTRKEINSFTTMGK